MIPKALQAYATMEALWSDGMDFIEIYALMSIPYLESVVSDDKHATDIGLQHFFIETYGLANITIGACRKILARLKKKRIVSQSYHSFVVSESMLQTFTTNRTLDNNINAQFKAVVQDIRAEVNSRFGISPTEQQVENSLLNFLSNNDGELVLRVSPEEKCSSKRRKPDTLSQKIRFAISQYVINIEKECAEKFNTILSFATGHMVASVMAMDDFTSFDGSLKNLTVYFDSPIAFALLNLTHQSETLMAIELIKRLQDLKVSLRIVHHHYNEISNSISYAISLLETEHPDLSKANKIYFFSERNNLTADDLRLKEQQIDRVLQQYGIVVESVLPKEAGNILLKWEEIDAQIKDIFTDNNTYSLPLHRVNSIKRDAKALEQIIAVRGTTDSQALSTCHALLATNNIGLCKLKLTKNANASRGLPVSVTIEDLSTIIWGNRPIKNSSLNKTKLLCDCSKNITLKASILRNFYNDLKIKHEAHAITDADYINATALKLAEKLLLETTLNNEKLYTDETAEDIIRRITAQTAVEKADYVRASETQQDHLMGISKTIANIASYCVGTILIGLSLFTKFWDWNKMSGFARMFFWIFVILFTLWGILNWLGVIPSRQTLREIIANRIYAKLSTSHKK